MGIFCLFSCFFRGFRLENPLAQDLIHPVPHGGPLSRFESSLLHGGLQDMAKKTVAAKAPTKTELFANIAEATQLNKKQVAAVMDALVAEVAKAVKGPGVFTLPGLLKVVVVNKPATKKKQVRNPATGEMVWSGPKPARKVIKVRALKSLKDMA
jgi:nucleoid DNA-binding protein